jgi:hypothetical protein
MAAERRGNGADMLMFASHDQLQRADSHPPADPVQRMSFCRPLGERAASRARRAAAVAARLGAKALFIFSPPGVGSNYQISFKNEDLVEL